MKTYQVNRCGCDFLISSSNSQVESPVLRFQMTLTRLTIFPWRSSTLRSSKAMGGTSTVRSSLIYISSASNTCARSNTYFLSYDTWNTGHMKHRMKICQLRRQGYLISHWPNPPRDLIRAKELRRELTRAESPSHTRGSSHPQEHMIFGREF